MKVCPACGEKFMGFDALCMPCRRRYPYGYSPAQQVLMELDRIERVTNAVASVTNAVIEDAAVTNTTNADRQRRWREAHAEDSRNAARARMRRKRANKSGD